MGAVKNDFIDYQNSHPEEHPYYEELDETTHDKLMADAYIEGLKVSGTSGGDTYSHGGMDPRTNPPIIFFKQDMKDVNSPGNAGSWKPNNNFPGNAGSSREAEIKDVTHDKRVEEAESAEESYKTKEE